MTNRKLLETVADIAYIAGYKKIYSGDSRSDMSEFIYLAEQFEKKHKYTNWEQEDYMLAIEDYANKKLKEYRKMHKVE